MVSYSTLKVVSVLKSHGLNIDGLMKALYALFIAALCRTEWPVHVHAALSLGKDSAEVPL